MALTRGGAVNTVGGNVPVGNGGNNAFGGMGGGIFIVLGTASLTNCSVSGNQTGTTGGGTDGYGGGQNKESPTIRIGRKINDNKGNAAGANLYRRNSVN